MFGRALRHSGRELLAAALALLLLLLAYSHAGHLVRPLLPSAPSVPLWLLNFHQLSSGSCCWFFWFSCWLTVVRVSRIFHRFSSFTPLPMATAVWPPPVFLWWAPVDMLCCHGAQAGPLRVPRTPSPLWFSTPVLPSFGWSSSGW